MIHLTMTPEEWSIRVYDQPDGYEKRLPYVGIVRVKCLNDRTVYLCGAIGKVDRETRAKGLALLRERGITTVMFERHGRMKSLAL